MDSKIQELTDKIYFEGVEKGNAEAERIIAEARAKAAEIEAEANKRAEEIRQEADRRARELKQTTESELKLYASQLVDSVRATVAEKLCGTIAQANVQALTVNPEYLQKVVLELVKHFDLNQGVVISTAQAEALTAYFQANAKELLEAGISIRSVAGKPTEFTVAPKDGSFKIQFGEAEFLELFKSFLRPQMAQILF